MHLEPLPLSFKLLPFMLLSLCVGVVVPLMFLIVAVDFAAIVVVETSGVAR